MAFHTAWALLDRRDYCGGHMCLYVQWLFFISCETLSVTAGVCTVQYHCLDLPCVGYIFVLSHQAFPAKTSQSPTRRKSSQSGVWTVLKHVLPQQNCCCGIKNKVLASRKCLMLVLDAIFIPNIGTLSGHQLIKVVVPYPLWIFYAKKLFFLPLATFSFCSIKFGIFMFKLNEDIEGITLYWWKKVQKTWIKVVTFEKTFQLFRN